MANNPYQEGKRAFRSQQNVTTCPYVRGTREYDSWTAGWWSKPERDIGRLVPYVPHPAFPNGAR